MAYKRIQQRYTTPDVLGYTFTGKATMAGSFTKTSQTCSNAPVYFCQSLNLYLFVGMDEILWESHWYVAAEVNATMAGYDEETGDEFYKSYVAYCTSSDMMYFEIDPDMADFQHPTELFFSTAGWYGGGASFTPVCTYLYDTMYPLLAAGADAYGRVVRISTAMNIPHEGLVFDAPFSSQVAKAVTGQELTYNLEGSGHFTTVYGLPALKTSWNYDSFKTNVTWSDAGFPAGRENRTVSMWVECEGGWGTQQIFTYGNKFQIEYSDDHGAVNIASDHGDHRYYTPITIGKWYHIAVVLQHEFLFLYMNGKLVYTAEFKSPKSTELTNLAVIGTDNGNSGNPGAIAGLRIYNRALDLTEIERLFDEHKDVVS